MKYLFILCLASCTKVIRVRSLEGHNTISHVLEPSDIASAYKVGDTVYTSGDKFCDTCSYGMAGVIELIK